MTSLDCGTRLSHNDTLAAYGITPTECFGPHKLTNLQLAIIHQDEEAVKALLENDTPVDARDARQWTALHHAALIGNKHLIQTLLDHKADPNALTDLNGTYTDIQRLTPESMTVTDQKIGVLWKEGTDTRELTDAEYYKITGSKFISDNIVAKAKMLADWRFSFPDDEAGESLTPSHDFVTRSAVQCVLTRITHDGDGRALKKPIGLGAFPATPMQINDIAGEYLGYDSLKPNRDGFQWGNPATRFNCGFPNLVPCKVRKMKGLPFRMYLVALEAINDSQLLWNYGWNVDKVRAYVELNPKGVRTFAKNVDISKACSAVIDNKIIRKEVTPEVVLRERFNYLLTTPSVLYQMFFDGTLSEERVRLIFNFACKHFINQKNCDFLLPNFLYDMIPIAKKYRELVQVFKEIHPSLGQAAWQFLFEAPEHYGLMATLHLDQYINTTFLIREMRKFQTDLQETSEMQKSPLQKLRDLFPNDHLTVGHSYWYDLSLQWTQLLKDFQAKDLASEHSGQL